MGSTVSTWIVAVGHAGRVTGPRALPVTKVFRPLYASAVWTRAARMEGPANRLAERSEIL
jgi:hypothetical protein